MFCFCNLTPHAIVIHHATGVVTIPPFGPVARVTTVPGPVDTIEVDGAMITVAGATRFGPVVDLPPPSDGLFYIVSALVGGHRDVAGVRQDVLVPGTGPNDGAVRDAAGKIIGVTRLNRVA